MLAFTAALALLLLLSFSGRCAGVDIGSTVHLPTTNLARPLQPLRETLFEGDISRFLRNQSLHDSYNRDSFHRTTENVMTELGATFGLSVPIKVLQLSFETSFNSISGGQSNVSAALLQVESYSRRLRLQTEAPVRALQQLPLRASFLQELRNLPEPPTGNSGWEPYDLFLRRWGTHYVSAISYGSWLRTWSTAQSSSSYTERQIKAKACAELQTGATPMPNVGGCAGITPAEMTAASQLRMNTQVEVRGGAPDTRAALTLRRTDALIEAFVNEGHRRDTEAVKYEFLPIWTPVLAQYHSSASHEWKVATALQAYYNGLLAFKCPPDNLTSPPTVLQEFRRVAATGMYQCVRQCQGCRADRDCNLALTGGCYCYGNSCIAALGEDGRASIQTRKDDLPQDVVPNRSCFYEFPSCHCRLESRENNCGSDNRIPIWNQATDSAV